MAALEPERLVAGRYRLLVVIGRGGMGAVWRAHDELLNRGVAVKEIIWPSHLEPAERETARRRAVREAQLAARLRHPNIVGIYDIVEDADRTSIVMELVPYRSLRDVVREDGLLAPAQAALVGLGVLAALQAAHEAGVMHRDVKPANILLGPEGRVVLTDFGIAKAADSPALTASGVLIGSPSYLAPERARGEPSGAAADLWALGASMYAAVEGRPPFDRDGVLASLTAVVADEPDPPTHAGPLWPVIAGLLSKDPAARLSAAEAEPMLRHVAAEGDADDTGFSPDAPATAASDDTTAGLTEPAPGLQVTTSQPEPAALNQLTSPIPVAPEDKMSPSEPVTSDGLASVPKPAVADDAAGGPEPPAYGDEEEEAPAERPSVLPVPLVLGPVRSARPRRLRPVPAALTVVILAAVIAGVVALVSTRSPGRQAALPPRASAPAPATSSAASPSSPSSPGSPRVTPSASGSSATATATAPGGGKSSALPAGYYRFTNSTGFSIGVPDGWQISHVGHYVYIRDPADSGIFLLIDQSDQPVPDPLANWQQQATARQSSYPGYHLIRLQSVYYPQAEKAADWEFTYDRNGISVEILNRNVLANARHAYALYWSTPVDEWNAYYHYFQVFAATFQPASVNQTG